MISSSNAHSQSAWNLAMAHLGLLVKAFLGWRLPMPLTGCPSPSPASSPAPSRHPGLLIDSLFLIITSGLCPCSSLCPQDFPPPKSLPRKLTFPSWQNSSLTSSERPSLGLLWELPLHSLLMHCCLVRVFLHHWITKSLKAKVLVFLRLPIQQLTDFGVEYWSLHIWFSSSTEGTWGLWLKAQQCQRFTKALI